MDTENNVIPAEQPKPYCYLVDDSTTLSPWITFGDTWAQQYIEKGKKVVRLWAHPDEVAAPGPAERDASAAAARILANDQAMRAIRSLRRLMEAPPEMTLQEVVDLVAQRLGHHAPAAVTAASTHTAGRVH